MLLLFWHTQISAVGILILSPPLGIFTHACWFHHGRHGVHPGERNQSKPQPRSRLEQLRRLLTPQRRLCLWFADLLSSNRYPSPRIWFFSAFPAPTWPFKWQEGAKKLCGLWFDCPWARLSWSLLLLGQSHSDAVSSFGLDNLIIDNVFMYTVRNYGNRVGAVVKLSRVKVLNV